MTTINSVIIVNKWTDTTTLYKALLGDSIIYDYHGAGCGNTAAYIFSSGGCTSNNVLNGSGFADGTSTSPVNMLRNTSFGITSLVQAGSASVDQITRDRFFATRGFTGDMVEVILYSTALSTSNRSRIENYLRDKYAITVSSGITSVTRDTITTYNSTIGSAKLVTSATDTGEFTQSVNVGDTNTYNLSAYAYTTGAAVTSSDVQLFYNGSTVSTTYTSVGSGWYKLTGTVTGANASRTYGVQVQANKTVYVDNVSLNSYVSSGTLTSSIFDSEFTGGAAWGTLTYSSSGSTVAVKVRTSNSSSMIGATDFSSCSAVTSGSDISSNSCVTDSHRYIQYQLSLSTSDTSSTPTFSDISTAFATYDADAPSISLTALNPDPNSDNTPTLSGTATDTIGTVSNVQFQMDSTSGSWTACTASDGSFNSASEAFGCTTATLTDGSHTMYVRATDSNSNTTASGSESSDTFTIDATAPTSIDLDSPGDNSYTNSERPTFKWKATSDATAGLSKYVLEIDNPSIGSGQPSGDFTIDDIPTSRTTDYETNKYVIHYENFSDSDSTNNYISVYTKSSSEWSTDSNSGQNDGKLREGKVSWKVKARDSVGNETSSSRTLFVDRTSPKVEFTQVNDSPFSSSNFSTTDKTPTLYGKITDSLSGGDSSQTQDENGPKIASGPKQVEVKVEKKEGLSYKLHTLYTISMDKPWYTCDGKEVSDNSKQKCDKYLPFEYTPKDTLDFGTYKITLTGKDKADNGSSETILTLNITTLAQIITPEERKTIEEEIKELPKEEQEKVKEELEITKPVEPSALEKAGEQISQTSKNILTTTDNIITGIFNGIGQGVKFTIDATGKALAFVGDKAGQALAFVGRTTSNTLAALHNGTQSILAFVGQGIGNGANAVGQGLAFAGGKVGQGISTLAKGTGNLLASIGQGIGNTGKTIGQGYNQLANNAPGVAKTILTGIGNGVSTTSEAIANATNIVATTTVKIAHNTASTIGNTAGSIASTTSTIAQNTGNFLGEVANNIGNTTTSIAQNTTKTVGNIAHNTGSAIASAIQKGLNSTKSGIANIAFALGEKTDDVSHGVGTAIIKIGYLFVPEPTKISNVTAVAISSTSVKVSWTTNHPANGKVNWGYKDGIYEFEDQTDKRTSKHEFVLENLKPDTEYHYEVMSQNRNYVYDANRKFKTPAE
ncbi:hypothetical protein A3E11_00355 [Candidatus Curtissbacteria bacterium RIFCSPHIGHO2_12_FULL_38_37]|nr:MAG: hypothetical protein A3E11_00355 [Candidatus Curtissbacteria bacterium RIFCSPHIGHO2_12_FULL_38_37]